MVTLLGLAFKGGPKNSSDLLLYLALADHADENGLCYPSVERLAMWCRQDSRNTRRNMPKLERAGWVKVVKVGRRKEYILDVPKLCLSALESGVKLTSEESSFVAKKIPDKMSAIERPAAQVTADKMSSIQQPTAQAIPDNLSSITTQSKCSKPDKMSAIERPTPDIDVARYRTFTSSIPDIDVTNTGHSRRLYREPLRTVIEPLGGTGNKTEIPLTSHADISESAPEVLAKVMLEQLAIVCDGRIIRMAAEAIRLQAGILATTPHDAMLVIQRRAAIAQANGERVNSFWFGEDSGWKGQAAPADRSRPDPKVGMCKTGGSGEPATAVEAAVQPEEAVPTGADTELGRRVWDGMKKAIKAQIGPQIHDTWVRPIEPLGVMNGELYLQLPSPDFSHVPDRYEISSYLPVGMSPVIHILTAKGYAA